MDGWRVIQLGADVPPADLVEAVDFYRADLLGLSVALRSQWGTLRQTISALRQARGRSLKILVGGRGLHGAEDLVEQLGADAYAAEPRAAVAIGNALVGVADSGQGAV